LLVHRDCVYFGNGTFSFENTNADSTMSTG
jgi:hypothetical protein